jgi:hypothetical protein
MVLDSEMPMDFVIAILVSTLLSLFAMGGILIWAIIKVRREPYPIMLTLTLGILTLISILAFTLTKQNVLATLAGAGLGAIAGSLTNVFQTRKPDPPKEGGSDGRNTEQHPGYDEETPRD